MKGRGVYYIANYATVPLARLFILTLPRVRLIVTLSIFQQVVVVKVVTEAVYLFSPGPSTSSPKN